jgi:hypothetical protein
MNWKAWVDGSWRWVAGGMLLFAAVVKAADGTKPLAYIESHGLSHSASFVLLHGLVFFEAALGVSLIALSQRRAVRVVAILTFAVFAVLLGRDLFRLQPPSCGCLGSLKLFDDARAELWFGVARNVAVVVWGTVATAVIRGSLRRSNEGGYADVQHA